MELKSYQRKVIENLEEYLGFVQEHKSLAKAFNQYWKDKIGSYNPLDGTGMEGYKNNITNAAHVYVKGFAYFMVFDKKGIEGAYTLDKAKELIGNM